MKDIQYKTTKDFSEKELKDLFLSVNWSSGNYPEKLVIAMRNSSSVFTARDGDKLVGLINVLDDGIMTAYVHYLLIMPEYQHRCLSHHFRLNKYYYATKRLFAKRN